MKDRKKILQKLCVLARLCPMAISYNYYLNINVNIVGAFSGHNKGNSWVIASRLTVATMSGLNNVPYDPASNPNKGVSKG